MSRATACDRVGVEAQRLQALARQARALDVVVVERHAAARLELARRGLADVVQQRREPQRRRRARHPGIARRLELRSPAAAR